MTEKTARKLIEKKAIVYWQPQGHDRIGQSSPQVMGRIVSADYGCITAITPYGRREYTTHFERVHECKNPEDIEWFENQEKKAGK